MTAIEWLFKELWDIPKDDFDWYEIRKKAIQMEKQQIIDAYRNGYNDGYNFNLEESEQYYQKNYGKTEITN
jgi:hypothetical protein